MASSPRGPAAGSIRSLPAFLYGLGLLNLGIAVVVAEASPLGLAETGSVAAMAAGAGAFVVIVAAPRADDSSGSDEPGP